MIQIPTEIHSCTSCQTSPLRCKYAGQLLLSMSNQCYQSLHVKCLFLLYGFDHKKYTGNLIPVLKIWPCAVIRFIIQSCIHSVSYRLRWNPLNTITLDVSKRCKHSLNWSISTMPRPYRFQYSSLTSVYRRHNRYHSINPIKSRPRLVMTMKKKCK